MCIKFNYSKLATPLKYQSDKYYKMRKNQFSDNALSEKFNIHPANATVYHIDCLYCKTKTL